MNVSDTTAAGTTRASSKSSIGDSEDGRGRIIDGDDVTPGETDEQYITGSRGITYRHKRNGSNSGVGAGGEGGLSPKPKKLSFPDYNSEQAQSAWDLSPRKYEIQHSEQMGTTSNSDSSRGPRGRANGAAATVHHSESLSVLNRRSFNFEEFFVHAAISPPQFPTAKGGCAENSRSSGSCLAHEAIGAADVLKEKK